MKYVITSSKKVCGKLNGEELTESDILSAGGSVEHLLASGNIKKAGNSPKETQEPQVIEDEPQVQQQETEAFVFNNVNYEGDK
jgi:hypothetical protein